jgi:ELWxxDGT repeat protein
LALDAYSYTSSADPQLLVEYDNETLFFVSCAFATCGTINAWDGANTVETIFPGASNIGSMAVCNGYALFTNTDISSTMSSVIRLDVGTFATTVILSAESASMEAFPTSLVCSPAGDKLYFMGQKPGSSFVTDSEWLVYDFSSAPTLAHEFKASGMNAACGNAARVDDLIAIPANDGVDGCELWIFDGSTYEIIDAYPGASSSNPKYMVLFDEKIVFACDTATSGRELCTFDDTDGVETIDIRSGSSSSDPKYLAVFNNVLYFSATGDDGVGDELLRWTGGLALPARAADIYVGATSSSPKSLVVWNGALFFGATDGGKAGREIWVMDEAEECSLAIDTMTDTMSSSAKGLVAYESHLIWGVQSSDLGAGLLSWSGVDGELPSLLSSSFGAAFGDRCVYNDMLYFRGSRSSDNKGEELYAWNGTDIFLAVDINPGSSGSSPAHFAVFDDKLYFQAYDSANGQELWVYDAASDTASLVENIRAGTGSSSPSYLTAYGDKLFFSATDGGSSGTELWSYDEQNGAQIVQDIRSGSSPSNPSYMTVFDDKLYFSANGGDGFGAELWVYDVTHGAVRATDISANSGSSSPKYLAAFCGGLFFAATESVFGEELWSFNGTHAALALDVVPGAANSLPQYLTVLDGKLFFVATDTAHGAEVWVMGCDA